MIYRKHPIRSLLTSMLRKANIDIIKMAVKSAEVNEEKTKYLQHLQQSCQIKQRYTFHLHPAFIE
jgi:hypothetical protein